MTARAFALTTFSFAVALAMIFAIALFAAPRTAFAAEQPDSESPRGALLPANVIPSPSIIEGVSQGMRQAHQDACERVEAEKTDKTLAYDPALIAAVGNQTADGHMICCPAYACAYGDAVMTREAGSHTSYGTLAYDPALIAAVGNQTADGHMICCPAYACAYGDAVMTREAGSHTSYGCGCCTWPGWGGGNSSFRSLGSNSALLREAYDEIAAGRPTVVHVSGSWGEHWICLIGYRGASDPDDLTLDNFIALDPVYGDEIIASDGYALYGDFCQHISDAR